MANTLNEEGLENTNLRIMFAKPLEEIFNATGISSNFRFSPKVLASGILDQRFDIVELPTTRTICERYAAVLDLVNNTIGVDKPRLVAYVGCRSAYLKEDRHLNSFETGEAVKCEQF